MKTMLISDTFLKNTQAPSQLEYDLSCIGPSVQQPSYQNSLQIESSDEDTSFEAEEATLKLPTTNSDAFQFDTSQNKLKYSLLDIQTTPSGSLDGSANGFNDLSCNSKNLFSYTRTPISNLETSKLKKKVFRRM